MRNTPHKLTPSLAGGLSVLMLQAVTAPLALVGLAQPDAEGALWLTGVYVALEVGAMVSAALVVWGIQSKRPTARLAPAVLLLPYWSALAVSGPALYHGVVIALFSGFALSMGAVTSLPLLSKGGRGLFEPRAESATALTAIPAGK